MFATLGRAAREREAQASAVRLTARVKELTRENRVLSSKVNQLGFMLSQSYAASVGAPVPDGGAARKGGGEVRTTHCEHPRDFSLGCALHRCVRFRCGCPAVLRRRRIARRRRRPQPPIALSGVAADNAVITASMISFPQWEVHIVTGRPSFGQTMVPRFSFTVSGLIVPEFLGVAGSSRKENAMAIADCVLA